MEWKNLLFRASMSLLVVFGFWGCKPKPPHESGTGKAQSDAQTLAPYGRESVIFSLAWLSGINSGFTGSPAQLQQHASQSMQAVVANDTVKQLLGDLEIAWGPVAFSTTNTDTSETDNTMVLFKGKDPSDPSKSLYVLAIAGTNSSSMFDWAFEDLNAKTMVLWPAPPTKGQNNVSYFLKPTTETNSRVTNQGNYISLGISIGINNLFNNMLDPSKGSIIDYLAANVGNQGAAEMVVTGHSLGGGLSPVAALLLKNNQSFWNSANDFTVSAHAFAGQTPGNMNFAQYLKNTLGPEGFQGAYNTLDVVPHGFQYDMMMEIGSLYQDISPDLQKECVIDHWTRCVAKELRDFNYTTLYEKENAFTADITLPDSVFTNSEKEFDQLKVSKRAEIELIMDAWGCLFDSKVKTAGRTGAFAYMALQNHIAAYVDNFQVQVFNDIQQRYIHRDGKDNFKVLLEQILVVDCIL